MHKSAGSGGMDGEREVDKKKSMIVLLFEKREVRGERGDVADLQVPWRLPFMCRADYPVIFSGKNELTDAVR